MDLRVLENNGALRLARETKESGIELEQTEQEKATETAAETDTETDN